MNRALLKAEIIKQIDKLPPALQERVLHYAISLSNESVKGVPGSELLNLAGILPAEDAAQMAEIIETDCERIDLNEW